MDRLGLRLSLSFLTIWVFLCGTADVALGNPIGPVQRMRIPASTRITFGGGGGGGSASGGADIPAYCIDKGRGLPFRAHSYRSVASSAENQATVTMRVNGQTAVRTLQEALQGTANDPRPWITLQGTQSTTRLRVSPARGFERNAFTLETSGNVVASPVSSVDASEGLRSVSRHESALSKVDSVVQSFARVLGHSAPLVRNMEGAKHVSVEWALQDQGDLRPAVETVITRFKRIWESYGATPEERLMSLVQRERKLINSTELEALNKAAGFRFLAEGTEFRELASKTKSVAASAEFREATQKLKDATGAGDDLDDVLLHAVRSKVTVNGTIGEALARVGYDPVKLNTIHKARDDLLAQLGADHLLTKAFDESTASLCVNQLRAGQKLKLDTMPSEGVYLALFNLSPGLERVARSANATRVSGLIPLLSGEKFSASDADILGKLAGKDFGNPSAYQGHVLISESATGYRLSTIEQTLDIPRREIYGDLATNLLRSHKQLSFGEPFTPELKKVLANHGYLVASTGETLVQDALTPAKPVTFVLVSSENPVSVAGMFDLDENSLLAKVRKPFLTKNIISTTKAARMKGWEIVESRAQLNSAIESALENGHLPVILGHNSRGSFRLANGDKVPLSILGDTGVILSCNTYIEPTLGIATLDYLKLSTAVDSAISTTSDDKQRRFTPRQIAEAFAKVYNAALQHVNNTATSRFTCLSPAPNDLQLLFVFRSLFDGGILFPIAVGTKTTDITLEAPIHNTNVSIKDLTSVEINGAQFSLVPHGEVLDDVVMLPLRCITSKLGGNITWDNSIKQASGSVANSAFVVSTRDKSLIIDGSQYDAAVGPYIRRSRTLVPQSFVEQII